MIAEVFVTGVAVLVLWFKFPMALPVLALAALAGWRGYRAGHVRQGVAASLSVMLMAVLLAYGSWKMVDLWDRGGASSARPAFMTWLKTGQADRADQAARYGLLIGAAAGMFTFFAGNRDFLSSLKGHGPGLVRGRDVVEGGWATERDVRSIAEFGPPREKPFGGGIVLGRLNGRILRVLPEKGKIKIAGHVFILGATGSAKSYTLIRDNIIAAVCEGKSLVVTDPKGELLEDLASWIKFKGYKVNIFNVLSPEHSHWWNMLMECRDDDEMAELADAMISCAGDDHAFFSGGEKNVLTAVIGYARWVLPKGQKHLRAALSLLAWPEDELEKAFQDAYRRGLIKQGLYETYVTARGHWSNYVEGVRNKLRTITTGGLAALTSESDFTLSDIGREKTALFCVLPTDGDYRMLLTPFYAFLFKRLKELAAASPKQRLPVPTRVVVEEAANVGRVPWLGKTLAVARSMAIDIQLAFQNIGQVQGLYSKEKEWQAIVGNCPVKVCLGCDDMDTATWFVRPFGDVRVLTESYSRDVTLPYQHYTEMPRRRESVRKERLMEPWELTQLPEDDMVATVRGKRPLYLQKIPWTDLPQYKEVLAAGQLPVQELIPARSLKISMPVVPGGPGEQGAFGTNMGRGDRENTDGRGQVDVMGLFNQP
ncbi:Type IV secretory system Conjugative DNA transfer [Pelotomaculum schinkii]|uniref:Type IV secretory system Conjugative DNA transfer n=1 Tax=Pelotomaculum schinkii TaxID=78350 RepID=A0A4Y7R7P8_9FIRM|nr:type IV secretory system conjugative DNA transfer family protein [Pelotomaculum schinkii]TEB04749.1 Type IV secretory system Conjugative DNA transfer [Pelotomaculum schinkii]